VPTALSERERNALALPLHWSLLLVLVPARNYKSKALQLIKLHVFTGPIFVCFDITQIFSGQIGQQILVVSMAVVGLVLFLLVGLLVVVGRSSVFANTFHGTGNFLINNIYILFVRIVAP